MYEYIKGKIITVNKDKVIIENNGIGYKVAISEKSSQKFKINEEQKIYTYLNVKEDEMSLFGFSNLEEKNMFEKLISVSKIGPKIALGILSKIEPHEFAMAVILDDKVKLSSLPGIGAKTAARIILELKDKIELDNEILTGMYTPDNSTAVEEAITALQVLGYYKKEIQSVIKKASENEKDVEKIIKNALRLLSK